MSRKTKIAIIVPIYNVEKYLKECLDSIKSQTYKNFLCICINDGSTDNSKSIAEKYTKKDKRFILVNQKNYGLGGARNTGIKKALKLKIPYISFIDSDDFVSKKHLEFLYKGIISGNYNICEAGRIRFDKTNYNLISFDKNKLTITNEQYNKNSISFTSLCLMIFKIEIFENLSKSNYNNVKIIKDGAEDFLLQYYINKKNNIKKLKINNRLYGVRLRKSGISNQLYIKNLFNRIEKLFPNIELNKKHGIYNSNNDMVLYLMLLLSAVHQGIIRKQKIEKSKRNIIKKLIMKININDYKSDSFLLKKRVRFIKVFGINFYILLKKSFHFLALLSGKSYKNISTFNQTNLFD